MTGFTPPSLIPIFTFYTANMLGNQTLGVILSVLVYTGRVYLIGSFFYFDFALVLSSEAVVAELQAGDMLVLPPCWLHHVETLEESVSVNFWSVAEELTITDEMWALHAYGFLANCYLHSRSQTDAARLSVCRWLSLLSDGYPKAQVSLGTSKKWRNRNSPKGQGGDSMGHGAYGAVVPLNAPKCP